MTDNELIAAWKNFVEELELGYRGSIIEYRRHLLLRKTIASAGLDEEVRDLDARFRAALDQNGRPRGASRELLQALDADHLA